MDAEGLNGMLSVKQIHFSMRQANKLVQLQRKKQQRSVLKQSHIFEPSCGMTMLYYVMNCGMKAFFLQTHS